MEEATFLALSVTAIICCVLSLDIQNQKSRIFLDFDQDGILQMGSESSEPFDSGSAVVDDDPEMLKKSKRREVLDERMSNETKLLMVQLHNLYRGNVTPPAADMSFLEWDDELEDLAQQWANECKFDHYMKGMYSRGPYNQNLYIGVDPSGNHAVWKWYEEYLHYDIHNKTCPVDQKCGHYLTMAAAKSMLIGCARKKCGLRYIIVCHYYPPLFRGEDIFTVGWPCSQCPYHEAGTKCFRNLCISREQCDRNPEICSEAECNLQCRNCGHLNETECHCDCADGWDSADCSRPCTNKNEECGKKINKYYCIKNIQVKEKHCREMCEECSAFNPNVTIRHTCCDGKMCPYGYVLNVERSSCKCILDCPGPLCDHIEERDFDDIRIKSSGVFSMKASAVTTRNNSVFPFISFLILYLCMSTFNK